MKKKDNKKRTKRRAKSKRRNNVHKNKKFVLWIFFGGFLSCVIIIGIVIGYLYTGKTIVSWSKIVYEKVPLPVVNIGSDGKITSDILFKDIKSVRRFYESKNYAQDGMRVDFSTTQGQLRLRIKEKDILNKLIEDKIVQKIASSKGIKISSDDIRDAVDTSIRKSGSNYEKLAINLESNYGWSVDDFKKKIVKNQLYLESLFQWYVKNIKNSESYKKALVIREKIDKDGSNFSDIAVKFSEGKSVKQDGVIDWIAEKNIIPELRDTIGKMQTGQISDVEVSPLGMHIVMLDGRREVVNAKGEKEKQIQLKQIFVRSDSFIDWLQEQKKHTEVSVLLQEYQWDANAGEVVFSDYKMKNLEKKIKIKSQGDPSL